MPEVGKKTNDTVELILRAAVEYNKTVHSVTRERPIEIVHSASRTALEDATQPQENGSL